MIQINYNFSMTILIIYYVYAHKIIIYSYLAVLFYKPFLLFFYITTDRSNDENAFSLAMRSSFAWASSSATSGKCFKKILFGDN